MQRIIVVYNPNSSRFAEVKEGVLNKTRGLNGYQVGKFEIRKTNFADNVKNLSKVVKDGDMVVSAGGDATGAIVANGILDSGKDAVLAVLPYGNFNDLARTLNTKKFEDIVGGKGQKRKLYPLEMRVDGKRFRYATCYVTVGMMAESVKIYDTAEVRNKLKTGFGRSVGSYTALMKWYFKNRHDKVFLPKFCLNGVEQSADASDYVAVNSSSMARVLKGGKDYRSKKIFRSKVDKLVSFDKIVKFMVVGMTHRVFGDETTGDVLEFEKPATVEIQAEGEYMVLKNIRKIEIKKTEKFLRVIEQ